MKTLRRVGRWLLAHPFVISLLWAFWLSALFGLFGPHSYVRVFDNADGVLPAKASMNLWVSGGEALGSWASSWASGVERGVIELDTMPFLVLPGWLAYWLVMFAQRLLAAYFGYRLARDRWSLNRAGAWFLALWYSAFFQPFINASWEGWTLYDGFTMAAVPAIMWLLLSAKVRQWRWLLLVAGAALLYAWTSSYPFAAFIIVLLPVILAASKDRPRGVWLALGLFAAVWAVAEVPELLPGMLNAGASHRADRAAFTPLTLPFRQQALLALQIVRDNLVGVLLGLWAALRVGDRRARVLLVAFAGAAVAVAFAHWGEAFLDRYGGPLSGFTLERFYFWLPFLAASMGAIGVNSLAESQRRAIRVVAVTAVVLVMVLSVRVNVLMGASMLYGNNYAAVLQDPALARLHDEQSSEAPFRVATVVAATGENLTPQPAFAWGEGLDTVDAYLSLYPQRYQDFWERVIGPLISQDERRYNYYHYWGNRIYLFEPTDGFPSGPVQVQHYYDLELLALANVRYLISGVELTDLRLHEFSGPGAIPQHPKRIYAAWRFLPFWLSQWAGPRVSSVYVYELEGTLPRAFVTASVRYFTTRDAMLDAMAAAELAELRTTAFVERSDGAVSEPTAGATGSASLVSSADRLDIEVESSESALLVVTEQYSRFWRAEVDGTQTRVTPADGPFMAVPIPAGHHTVVLRYDPPYGLPFVP